MNTAELQALQQAEYDDLLALLRDLTPAQWEHPSLCPDWQVRDVVGHIAGWDSQLATETGGALAWSRRIVGLAATFTRRGMSVERMNTEFVAAARQSTTDELIERLAPGGAPRLFERSAPGSQLAEYVVHHQDIRRPLGLPRAIPADRLRAALDGISRLPGVGARRRARGLSLRATDVDWSSGDGPEVRGPGESMLLALAGRPVGLDDLEGDGVSELSRRLR